MIRTQDPKQITHLTIHCTATPAGRAHTAAEVTRWANQRFGQPSYHHVVEIDGVATQVLRDDQVGAHVRGHNRNNIGVVYVGGLLMVKGVLVPRDTRSLEQIASLRSIVNDYRKRYPGIIVRGHRDWSADLDKDGKIEPHEWMKACPCFDVATQL